MPHVGVLVEVNTLVHFTIGGINETLDKTYHSWDTDATWIMIQHLELYILVHIYALCTELNAIYKSNLLNKDQVFEPVPEQISFDSSKLEFHDVHCMEFQKNFLGCMQFDWKFLLLITISSSPIRSKWSISLSLKSSTTYTWNQFWFHYGSEVQYSNPHAFCDENEIKWRQNESRKSTEVDTSMGFGTRITFPPENFNFIITLLAMESLCHDFKTKYCPVPWKK